MNSQLLQYLKKRVSHQHLSKRLKRQINRYNNTFYNRFRLYRQNFKYSSTLLKHILHVFGLLEKGRRNSLDLSIEKQTIFFDDLPPDFDGLRILQLSDIHIDAMIDSGTHLKRVITKQDFDLCVITGDFHSRTFSVNGRSHAQMADLASVLNCKYGIFGVLGNHDYIESTFYLEKMGIRILLNENIVLEHGQSKLWLVGTDDVYYYKTDDLTKALQRIPHNDFKIMLAHSAELVIKAHQCGMRYYICGHTHGGQICLPGGIPIITNTSGRRKFVSGLWRYKQMRGYTSRGTGSSGLQVRFNCPPEITIHVLKNSTSFTGNRK
ncbi:metallophosphoesterase [Desulfococcaceae bacterium HSG7]|nr:metallophosphoesterase [Desulfococcaceae bacterium HSG7]